jgi:hypothetical protein
MNLRGSCYKVMEALVTHLISNFNLENGAE